MLFCRMCIFCGEKNETFTEEMLDMHYWKSCPMLKRCDYCAQVMQILDLVVDDVDDFTCVCVLVACVPLNFLHISTPPGDKVHFWGCLLQPIMSFTRLGKSMATTMTGHKTGI